VSTVVVDPLMHRQPMELTSQLSGTGGRRSMADCPRQFILSNLQTVQVSDRRSMQQRVTVVESRCNNAMRYHLGSFKCKQWSNISHSARVWYVQLRMTSMTCCSMIKVALSVTPSSLTCSWNDATDPATSTPSKVAATNQKCATYFAHYP